MSTAGKAVAFSGIAVAISMLGLLFFPMNFLQSMGLGGAMVHCTGGHRGSYSAASYPRDPGTQGERPEGFAPGITLRREPASGIVSPPALCGVPSWLWYLSWQFFCSWPRRRWI